MVTLALTSFTYILCGNRAASTAQTDELVTLADEKGAAYWRAFGMWMQGWLCALTGKAAEAVQMLNSGMSAWRSTGATLYAPTQWSCLAAAHASLGQFDDAQRSISAAIAAMETSKETWFDAEVNRVAGVIALMSAEPDAAKAQEYFERALTVARQQQAKSWELRAAMSMARLWRDQGKPDEARELLAPVYGWFTEGFDTLDLKEAKALLDELAA
jgi:predicted ATPase